MKLPKIAAKDWKLIRLALYVLVPVLFYTQAVKPYRAKLSEVRLKTEEEMATLLRERDAVETAKQNPLLQQTTDSALKAFGPRLFDGRDDVMAGSELAAYLGEIAYDHQVWLQDAQTRGATSTTPGVRVLHVEMRAESDLQGIIGFLKALERGSKLVRIDRLDITKGARGATGAAGKDDVETLAVSATVSGYALGELSSAPASKLGKTTPTTQKPVASAGKGSN